MARYILDASAVSMYIWGKIVGIDKAKDSVTGRCVRFKDIYKCDFSTGKSLVLNEYEFSKFKNMFPNERIGPDTYEFKINKETVDKFRRVIETISNVCSRNQCYVTPDLGIELKSGKFLNPFVHSITEGTPIYVPWEKIYNRELREFINKYNIKVLVDRDLKRWIGDVSYERLVNNLKRIYGDNIETDTSNTFRPIFVLNVDGMEVVINVSENRVKVGNKIITLGPKQQKLEEIFEVLENSGVEIQKIKEAIKRLKSYDVEKGISRSYRQESAIIDAYIKAVARGDVKVITADKDIRGIKLLEEVKKENVIIVS